MAWQTPPTFTTLTELAATDVQILSDDLAETSAAKVTTKGDLAPATGANALARLAAGANGSRLTAASGETTGLLWRVPQYVSAHRSAAQTLTNNTLTAIALTAADDFDSNALHDPSTNNTRLIAAVAGKYLVGGRVTFATNTTGKRSVSIQKNGGGTGAGATYAIQDVVSAPSGDYHMDCMGVVSLAANDYIELYALQISTANLNVNDGVLWMVLLGEA